MTLFQEILDPVGRVTRARYNYCKCRHLLDYLPNISNGKSEMLLGCGYKDELKYRCRVC